MFLNQQQQPNKRLRVISKKQHKEASFLLLEIVTEAPLNTT